MKGRRAVFALVALVLVGVGVGLAVWQTSSGSKKTFSHADYLRLYNSEIVGVTRIDAVDQWPKPPYQDFHDSVAHHCYEWLDAQPNGTKALYDLCFSSNGLLASKARP